MAILLNADHTIKVSSDMLNCVETFGDDLKIFLITIYKSADLKHLKTVVHYDS